MTLSRREREGPTLKAWEGEGLRCWTPKRRRSSYFAAGAAAGIGRLEPKVCR
jgi:hypothetical protein